MIQITDNRAQRDKDSCETPIDKMHSDQIDMKSMTVSDDPGSEDLDANHPDDL